MEDQPSRKARPYRHTKVIAIAVGVVGLMLVWFIVNMLWSSGWSMPLVHLTAMLGSVAVTVAASLIILLVISRYRGILERKNRDLERLAAIGETVAGTAHHQKNLLNGLRGGLYVANSGMKGRDYGRLQDGWSMLNESVLRIERLTMDMLYYVKERVPRREPTDVAELMNRAISVMRESAARREVSLRAEVDEEMGEAMLDGTAVNRALLNLVSNAIDACAETRGGGLVTLKCRAVGGKVVLSVMDNGVGMPDDVLSNLFVRFYSTKGGQGTGLGLVVTKEVVEQHGGYVAVESQPGKGSAFHLHFPAALGRCGGREADGRKELPRSLPGRVLARRMRRER